MVCVGISSIRPAAIHLVRVGSTVQQEIDPILLAAQPLVDQATWALGALADRIGGEENSPEIGTA